MKHAISLFVAFVISMAIMAQGKSGDKGKGKQKTVATDKGKGNADKGKGNDNEKAEKEKKDIAAHDNKIWEGTHDNDGGGPKPSKNQPAKVRQGFQRDYPNATNVTWSKYRGDWTATFGNGLYRSTAIYHANGERKDTRTIITRDDIPKKVLETISKRSPETKTEEAVKVNLPRVVKNAIYRVKTATGGTTQFEYYDEDGQVVKYDY
jgi:hypothetical protein